MSRAAAGFVRRWARAPNSSPTTCGNRCASRLGDVALHSALERMQGVSDFREGVGVASRPLFRVLEQLVELLELDSIRLVMLLGQIGQERDQGPAAPVRAGIAGVVASAAARRCTIVSTLTPARSHPSASVLRPAP